MYVLYTILPSIPSHAGIWVFVDIRLNTRLDGNYWNMRLIELAFELAAYGMNLTYGLLTIRAQCPVAF